MRKKAQLFCQCLRGRTNLTTRTLTTPPLSQRIGQIWAFIFELRVPERHSMVIGCINCHQGIKFVCMNIPLIGWSGLLNIGRERSFVCSESKYVDQLMCGREFVYVCCACCVDEIVSSILTTIGLPFFNFSKNTTQTALLCSSQKSSFVYFTDDWLLNWTDKWQYDLLMWVFPSTYNNNHTYLHPISAKSN